jgi:hypothetical protein
LRVVEHLLHHLFHAVQQVLHRARMRAILAAKGP